MIVFLLLASFRIDKGAAKRFVKSALWQPDTGKQLYSLSHSLIGSLDI